MGAEASPSGGAALPGRQGEEAPGCAPDAPRRSFRLVLEFDGAGFSGWQRQPVDRTVQAVVEAALSRILCAPVAVVGSGRTDAGVHARGLLASFEAATALRVEELARALDALLPEDVGVVSLGEAAPGFHARIHAAWKWYRYTWLRSRRRQVHLRRTAWRVGAALDVAAMDRALHAVRGRHDFAAFQSSGSPRTSTVRTILGARLLEEGDLLHLDLVADGFLYGMVRAVAGTLLEVGRGARTPEAVVTLVGSRDRTRAGAAAPAHGLVLVAAGTAAEPLPAFVDPSLAAGLESGHAATSPAPRGERTEPCES